MKDSSAPSPALMIVPGSELPALQRQAAPAVAVAVRANPVAPGYVAPMAGVPAPSMGATADNRFAAGADEIIRSTGEVTAWQGKPALVYLAPAAIAWALVLLFAISWATSAKAGGLWVLFWTVCAAFQLGKSLLAWKNTLYKVTSQRLEVTTGLLSQDTETVNLIDITQVKIERRFPWNLLGYGNLVVDVVDMSGGGHIRLKGLRDLPQVRDLIHASSNISGQLWDQYRFGRPR